MHSKFPVFVNFFDQELARCGSAQLAGVAAIKKIFQEEKNEMNKNLDLARGIFDYAQRKGVEFDNDLFFYLIEQGFLQQAQLADEYGFYQTGKRNGMGRSALDCLAYAENPNLSLTEMAKWLIEKGECVKGEPRPMQTTWRPLMQVLTSDPEILGVSFDQMRELAKFLMQQGASLEDSYAINNSVAGRIEEKFDLLGLTINQWKEIERSIRDRQTLVSELSQDQLIEKTSRAIKKI